MLLKCDEKYNVHNFMIDEQHKKLFELANIAYNMISRQTDSMGIKRILIALFDYMKTHFKNEEAYMESINLHLLDSYKEHYRDIVFEILLLIKNMKYDFKQQFMIIIEEWLITYIIQEYIRIVEHQQEMLKKGKIRESTDLKLDDNVLEKSFLESEYSPKNHLESNLNINYSKTIKKDSVLHIYSCMCGKIYNISHPIHKKIMEGKVIYCKHCNTNITYINDMKV